MTIIGIVAALLVAVPVALQVFLDSPALDKLVGRYAPQYLDAELKYSDIDISLFRRFPKIRVSMDSLSLTYPHERFSAHDGTASVDSRLLDAGRGACVDTLASFDRFSAAVNVWQLLYKRVRLSYATLSGLKLYAHRYDSTAANWDIFISDSTKVKDTDTTSNFSLPAISVGEIRLDGCPRVVFTSQSDTVYADLSFLRMAVAGDVKIKGPKFRTRGISLLFDSLKVNGRLPSDTLSLSLDSLRLRQCERRRFDVALGASAMYCSHSLGRLDIPVWLDGRLGYLFGRKSKTFDVERLDADVAYVPMHLEGKARMWSDSTRVDAKLDVIDCELGKILDRYGRKFSPAAKDIRTDARLNLSVKADGILADGCIPAVEAALYVPRSSLTYKPLETSGAIALDASASISPKKYVKADVKALEVDIPGFSLDAGAKLRDLLGRDPAFDVNAKADAALAELVKYLPDSLGITAKGCLHAVVDAKATRSQFSKYTFDKASLNGAITGDDILAAIGDMKARLSAPSVEINSGEQGILLDICADTVYFKNGDGLSARARSMKNTATVSKVPQGEYWVPRVAFHNSERSLFLKSGVNRVILSDTELAAAMQGRPRTDRRKRNAFVDSLQRRYPDVPRDSMVSFLRKKYSGMQLPSYMTEKDFRKSDIHIDLGESFKKLLTYWSPSGSLYAGRGFFASPGFPLRTRFSGVDIKFDDNDLDINKLAVKTGTSDISVDGKVTGIRGTLMGRGMIKADLNVNSSRLNVNEIISALAVGSGTDAAGDIGDDYASESDESFVTDTLADVKVNADAMSLIVIPANLIATVKVKADTVNYSEILVNPMSATVNVGKRCVQITDTKINSDYGDIDLDAYYSTRTKKDISAGLNLSLNRVSAGKIINLIPSVDTLMPLLKSFKGDLGCNIAVTTQLDTNMNVLMPTVDGVVHISGEDLMIEDAGSLRKLTKRLLFKNKDIGRIQNMYVDAVVHDNKLEVFPFIISVDRYKMALAGMQDFDDVFNYHVSILSSPFLIKFGVNLYGTFDKWKFMLCRAKYRDGVPAYSREIENTRLNIAESIRNICSTGVSNAMLHSAGGNEALSLKRRELNLDELSKTEELSGEEQLQMDAVELDQELEEVEARINAEVDEIVSQTLLSSADLQKEYETLTFDKRVEKQLKKIRKNKTK